MKYYKTPADKWNSLYSFRQDIFKVNDAGVAWQWDPKKREWIQCFSMWSINDIKSSDEITEQEAFIEIL